MAGGWVITAASLMHDSLFRDEFRREIYQIRQELCTVSPQEEFGLEHHILLEVLYIPSFRIAGYAVMHADRRKMSVRAAPVQPLNDKVQKHYSYVCNKLVRIRQVRLHAPTHCSCSRTTQNRPNSFDI